MSQQPGFGDFARQAKGGLFWRVLGIYLLGSWIALQVVDVLVDSAGLPDWFPTFALALLVIGLPIVLATAVVQQGLRQPGASEAPSAGTATTASETAATGGGTDAGSPGAGNPRTGAATSSLAAGTGSLDRPTTRPPRLLRLLTWKNAVTGGVLAFALWGVLAAVWLGLTAWIRGDEEAPAPLATADEILHAIAVLPFENLSPDPDNAYFADGIHEDVLTQLSKIGDLTVISRTSVLNYRDSEKSLSEIGAELGVGSIVEGSVRRAGDNVRITAQLIDARTDQHLWADNFDRALTAANVFSIQSEIARQIAGALATTLSPEEEVRLGRLPTGDLGAYDFYAQGRAAYQRYTGADNDEAIRLFARAIELDAGFAEAWAGLSDAYSQRVIRFGYDVAWSDSAEVVARRAIELDPESSAAYKALASVYLAREDWEPSTELHLRAAELDPSNFAALANAAIGYEVRGAYGESVKLLHRAAEVAPGPITSTRLATYYLFLGMEDRAAEILDRVLDLDGQYAEALFYRGWIDVARGNRTGALEKAALIDGSAGGPEVRLEGAMLAGMAGDFEHAGERARSALAEAPSGSLFGWHHVGTIEGLAFLRTGETEAGQAVLRKTLEEVLSQVDSPGTDSIGELWELSAIHALLDDRDSALEWARRGNDAGYRLAYLARIDPAFDGLRVDPGWLALLDQMEADLAEQRREVEAWERSEGLR